jgi:alpha-galactosidase
MIRTDNTVSDLQIAYIGGGSKGWAWGLMSDLATEKQLSGQIRLYDIDQEAAKANETIGNQLTGSDDTLANWTYTMTTSLQEALTGADFVIISILPGTFDHMEIDVHHPEKYGIYQSVGDTAGPGGLMRALRTIPMFETIANAIKDYSPDAWVLNYTNPMTICTRTLYTVFPEIKAFGNCHEVFGTQKLLVEALADIKGIEDVPREDIKVSVTGINHFTWLTSASYKDMDLYPIYKEFAEKYYESGFEGKKSGNWLNDFFSSAQRIKFDLFLRYGFIAAAGDRHLAEFCPNQWYLKDLDTIKSWKFSLTPVSWRKENEQERINKSNQLVHGEQAFEIKETGEEGVLQMKALLGLGDLVTNVNLPNQGQVAYLPSNVVVESNALLRHNSISPISGGSLNPAVTSMIAKHSSNQEMIVEAGLTRNRALAFQAFLNDPLVNLSLDDAKECFDYMYDHVSSVD